DPPVAQQLLDPWESLHAGAGELLEGQPMAGERVEHLLRAALDGPCRLEAHPLGELVATDPVVALIGARGTGERDPTPRHGALDDAGDISYPIVLGCAPDVERLVVHELP